MRLCRINAQTGTPNLLYSWANITAYFYAKCRAAFDHFSSRHFKTSLYLVQYLTFVIAFFSSWAYFTLDTVETNDGTFFGYIIRGNTLSRRVTFFGLCHRILYSGVLALHISVAFCSIWKAADLKKRKVSLSLPLCIFSIFFLSNLVRYFSYVDPRLKHCYEYATSEVDLTSTVKHIVDYFAGTLVMLYGFHPIKRRSNVISLVFLLAFYIYFFVLVGIRLTDISNWYGEVYIVFVLLLGFHVLFYSDKNPLTFGYPFEFKNSKKICMVSLFVCLLIFAMYNPLTNDCMALILTFNSALTKMFLVCVATYVLSLYFSTTLLIASKSLKTAVHLTYGFHVAESLWPKFLLLTEPVGFGWVMSAMLSLLFKVVINQRWKEWIMFRWSLHKRNQKMSISEVKLSVTKWRFFKATSLQRSTVNLGVSLGLVFALATIWVLLQIGVLPHTHWGIFKKLLTTNKLGKIITDLGLLSVLDMLIGWMTHEVWRRRSITVYDLLQSHYDDSLQNIIQGNHQSLDQNNILNIGDADWEWSTDEKNESPLHNTGEDSLDVHHQHKHETMPLQSISEFLADLGSFQKDAKLIYYIFSIENILYGLELIGELQKEYTCMT